jgi:hypothetical protein
LRGVKRPRDGPPPGSASPSFTKGLKSARRVDR